MGYIFIGLAVLLAIALLFFMIQNVAAVTVSFLAIRLTLPMWLELCGRHDYRQRRTGDTEGLGHRGATKAPRFALNRRRMASDRGDRSTRRDRVEHRTLGRSR